MPVMLLVDAGLKATVLLFAAAIADRLLRRASSSARHVIWIAALAGVLLLPPFALLLPAWRMPVALPSLPGIPETLFAVAAGQSGAAPAAAAARAPAFLARRAESSGAYLLWLPWLAGFALVAARMAAGAWAVRRIARRASAPPAALAASAARLAGACCVQADVRLAGPRSMPMTCGILRPRILLPAEAVHWAPGKLDAVLLHELAHVRRRDTLWHAVGSLACAVFWPHPLAWLALRRALALRERAADDFVLTSGARPSDYAGTLLEIARSLSAPRLCRGAAMARPSQLEGRLRAILERGTGRGAASRGFAALASTCAVAAALLLAPLHPVRAQDPADAGAALAAYDFDRAVALSRDALVAAESRHGAQSPEFARALLTAGKALLAVDDDSTAAQSFERASAVLAAAAPDDPALPEALYRSALYAGADARMPRYENALAAARRAARDDIAALALLQMAQTLRAVDPARAGQFFEEAILVQSRLDKPVILAGMLEAYAVALRNAGRAPEADAAAARARLAREQAAPQTAPPPPRPEGVFRVGSGVQAPRLLFKLEPEYTQEARAAKFQGKVVLYVEVGPDGEPRNTRVLRSLGLGLDEKALRAVRQWRFAPGMKEGQPVAVAATIEMNFRLL